MHSPCCMPTIPDGKTCQRKGQNRNHPQASTNSSGNALPEIDHFDPFVFAFIECKGGSLRRNIRRNLPDRNAGGIRILHIIDHSQRQFRYGVELQKDRSISGSGLFRGQPHHLGIFTADNSRSLINVVEILIIKPEKTGRIRQNVIVRRVGRLDDHFVIARL